MEQNQKITFPKLKPGPKPGDPRMAEAGRKGGAAVKEKYGPEFFKEIGRKGGKKTKEKHGLEQFSKIGKMGVQARRKDV